MTDEHLIWADMRKHRDGELRVYADGPGKPRLVSGTYPGDVVAEFDAAVAELVVLRAQRDATLAVCASVDAAWVGQSHATGTSMPLLRTAPVVTTGAVRAALGVQPEGS
jgi:hypothetical protein